MNQYRSELRPLINLSEEVMPGKAKQTLYCFAALAAQGHVLIEDIPGMGKTTLISFLAQAIGLKLRRIQFTNDLLPADILGTSVFNTQTSQLDFRPGPIFGELILGDELNRAPPKTQSALLQAMEERMISIDGADYKLPAVFTVMATQNPRGMSGTFPLPESQLDRFLMKIPMGLPPRESEKRLIEGSSRREMILKIKALFSVDDILAIQSEVTKIKTSETLIEYIMRLLDESRSSTDHRPLSPRAGLDIVRASRAWAWINQRDYVIPEDVKEMFPLVAGHRLPFQEVGCRDEHALAQKILDTVAIV